MPDRFAPALLLDVLAFWFVLRWVLPEAAILLLGRLLVAMMVVGMLGTLDQHHYVWALFFAGSAALAWALLHHWRNPHTRGESRKRLRPTRRAWRRVTPDAAALLCERRIGFRVDAAVPAQIAASPPASCVLALAGDALWVLEDQSSPTRPQVGRVLDCWARHGLVAHVEHARRGDQLELSWPGHGVLVRGVMPSGPTAELFAGHLLADEFALRP